ncbi:hypothetical protein RA265_29695, partial [Pseudomonas syringae pv. tagetis]|uniref:hypothetical protein n=1 Tax=Pseudomonas syringae group genomosp. 7 TaxID=251699 RepID=UPI0037706A12
VFVCCFVLCFWFVFFGCGCCVVVCGGWVVGVWFLVLCVGGCGVVVFVLCVFLGFLVVGLLFWVWWVGVAVIERVLVL